MQKYKTITNPTPLFALMGNEWAFKYNLNPLLYITAIEGQITLGKKSYDAILFATTKYPHAAILMKDVEKVQKLFSLARGVKVTLEQNPGGACRIIQGAFQGFDNKYEQQKKLGNLFNFSKTIIPPTNGKGGTLVALPLNIITVQNISNITDPPIRYTPPASEIGGDITQGGTQPTPETPPISGGMGGGGDAAPEEPATQPAATTTAAVPFYKNKYFIGSAVVAGIVSIFCLGKYFAKKSLAKK